MTTIWLIDKYQQRAQEVADSIEPAALRRLLCFLIDTVLQRSVDSYSESIEPTPAVQTSPPVGS